MANLHNTFLKFEKAISLTPKRKQKLIASRKAVEAEIVKYFKANSKLPVPKFFIQGSYKMGTMIIKKDNTYDVDLGVYFEDTKGLQAITLQQNVARAIKNQTEGGVQHKEKCIRVIYQGEFNIDLPIYYIPKTVDRTQLATKSGWEYSDSKALVNWFEQKKDKNGQLLRLIKYAKAWADSRSRKMPSGIALSVWIAKFYVPNKRDDISFVNTLSKIKEEINWSWNIKCKNPVPPNDNLISKLSSEQISRFVDALKSIIKDGKRAINEKDKNKAINIWSQYFNRKRFLI